MSNEPKSANPRRDVLRIAKEHEVRFVRLVFADILGMSKSVSIPIARLDAALDGQITFDGGSIDGFVRGEELDMQLLPDISTFAISPWSTTQEPEARLICEIAMPDGTPFEGCPRSTLRRAVESTRDVLADIRISTELEFFLFEHALGEPDTLKTSDVASYFDFPANDRGEATRIAIVAALEAMGVRVDASHHEHGAGQHEIDFAALEPLAAADAIMSARAVAKHVAARFELDATFMPKPLEDRAGSGLHVELCFSNDDDEGDTLLFAVGGLLAHANAVTAVCNPTVNSYKRLVAAWDAPIYAVWSERSANALVRVPRTERGGHVEIRSPDPSCNPYLAFAAILGAAADGIRVRRLPGDPFVGSTYELDAQERRKRGIGTLPKSLRQAIDALEDDQTIRAMLGDHLYHAFRDAKFSEYERYRRAVHAWEHRAYLRQY